MIQLFIQNTLVDVDDKLSIVLSKVFQDTSFEIVDATYSYSLQLPITINNKSIFEYQDNIDVLDKFNKNYQAQLYVDENLILDGNFLLTRIDSDYYSGNLYIPKQKKLTDIIGSVPLSGISPSYVNIAKLSDMNNCNNIEDSPIKFPYYLYSLPCNGSEFALKPIIGKYTQDLIDNTFNPEINIFPAFKVVDVVKNIFKTVGYNVKGSFFDNPKFNKLYQSYKGEKDSFSTKKESTYFTRFSGSYSLRKEKTHQKQQVFLKYKITLQFVRMQYYFQIIRYSLK